MYLLSATATIKTRERKAKEAGRHLVDMHFNLPHGGNLQRSDFIFKIHLCSEVMIGLVLDSL